MSRRYRTLLLAAIATGVLWVGVNARPLWWAWLRYAEQSYALEPLTELADLARAGSPSLVSNATPGREAAEVTSAVATVAERQQARTDELWWLLVFRIAIALAPVVFVSAALLRLRHIDEPKVRATMRRG